ncbi:MAG: hypothetical protein ABL963_16465 [Longimicrobiales bacterium]
MTAFFDRARTRATATALLLIVAGAALGIVVDRLWLSAPADEMSLTAGAMADQLGLTPEDEARLVVLLDSLHTEVTAAAAAGPDALRRATDAAHMRIAASLPPESRSAFHGWMQEHHEHMMQQMGMGSMMHGEPPR